MLKRSRIAAASATALMFAGWIYSQPQSGSPAEQLQATIQRLQNEIKSLQSTLLQLKSARTSAEPTAAQPTAVGSRIQQARTAYNDGRRLEDQKLYRAAVEYFANAIQLDPMNDAAYLHRAYCYHQLGDENAAVADFTQSLEVQPNNSRAYLGRATANAAMGKRAEALDDADEALRRDANSFEAFLLRGRLYQQQGDSERALADFASAQALSPKSEQPYLSRAETNLRDGKTDDAVADCDAALRLNPNSYPAYLCRAHAYIQMGKSDRAIEEISRASRAAQSLDMPLAFLNDTWQALDPKGALPGRRAPATVPAKSPVNPPANPLDPRKSPMIAGASPLVQATPDPRESDNPAVLEYTALTLAQKRNFPSAFAFIDRAISLDPTRARSYHTRGLLHLWLWQYEKAAADFSEVIRINPTYGLAYRNRASARRGLGDLKLAKEDDQKADSLSSGSALSAKR